MQKIDPLEFNKYYHIYNCGINGMDLFRENTDYKYFLNLYEKHIDPVVDTYAWCLMRNHFHLLIKIKEEEEIISFYNTASVRVETPTKQFSRLFSAYSQTFNKRYRRNGNLFERPFNRKHIDNEERFRQLVVFIHDNPTHHGFVSYTDEYPWSSYLTLISTKSTKLKRNEVIGWFGDIANFKAMHQNKIDVDGIEDWLEI